MKVVANEAEATEAPATRELPQVREAVYTRIAMVALERAAHNLTFSKNLEALHDLDEAALYASRAYDILRKKLEVA